MSMFDVEDILMDHIGSLTSGVALVGESWITTDSDKRVPTYDTYIPYGTIDTSWEIFGKDFFLVKIVTCCVTSDSFVESQTRARQTFPRGLNLITLIQ